MRINSPFGANSYRAGGSWGICDECGGQFRLSEMKMRWDKALVCEKDWEPRHPQEFVKGRKDRIRYPGPIRPEPDATYTIETLVDENGDPIRDEFGPIVGTDNTPTQEDL